MPQPLGSKYMRELKRMLDYERDRVDEDAFRTIISSIGQLKLVAGGPLWGTRAIALALNCTVSAIGTRATNKRKGWSVTLHRLPRGKRPLVADRMGLHALASPPHTKQRSFKFWDDLVHEVDEAIDLAHHIVRLQNIHEQKHASNQTYIDEWRLENNGTDLRTLSR